MHVYVTSTSKRYAPDATRQAIIDSALKLFERNGFHATSVQAVADDADVTKGAFYHHFKSKEQLVHIILGELLDHMLRELDRIEADTDDPAGRLRALIGSIVDAAVRFRSHVAVYYQERRYLRDADFAEVRRKREVMLARMRAIVCAGIEDGTFRDDIDPDVALFGINGMAAWAHQWLDPAGGVEPARVADLLSNMVLGGLAKA
jgi:AcrR family transcriptional regulator